MSLMQLVGYDAAIGSGLLQGTGGPLAISCSGPHGLVEGRNLAVRRFLDETELEWLWFIDTDMGFAPDTLERLWLAADPVNAPVVGGLCFAMKHVGNDGMGGFKVMPLPTLFKLAKTTDGVVGFVNRFTYPEDSMLQVAGTGAACILIHRSILEGIRAKHGDSWFDLVSYENGKTVSEDLSFCWRVGDLGAPIFVHTGIKITHHKELWLGADDYVMPEREPQYREVK
jgi:hypothetical protein